MKIIVASDSHGNQSLVDELFQKEVFDCFIFCGDGERDFSDHYGDARLEIVGGNCDWFSQFEDEMTLALKGKRIFITHGHKYFVKSSLAKLVKRAKDVNADFVFYGHTHRQSVEKIDGIYFINPGALKNGQYVLIELQQDGNPVIEQKKIYEGER